MKTDSLLFRDGLDIELLIDVFHVDEKSLWEG